MLEKKAQPVDAARRQQRARSRRRSPCSKPGFRPACAELDSECSTAVADNRRAEDRAEGQTAKPDCRAGIFARRPMDRGGRLRQRSKFSRLQRLHRGKPLVKTLTGLSGNVNAVGFSADGSLLFAAAGEPGLFGELTLWNTDDWTRRLTMRGHRDALLAAALSPDGKIVATGSYDQTIRLWDPSTGKELRLLKGHNGPVFDLAFDPTGRLLASASGDRTVKLWDVA